MKFFGIYQYLGPLITFPLSYWLWWRRYDGDHGAALFMLSFPILFAYIVPAVGMSVLKLWEFNTRYKIGSIRPHHGFMFGSSTSLFALLSLPYPWTGSIFPESLRAAFVVGSVIAFWNWIYDIHAIRVGFIRVFNRKWHEGRDPEVIATEYAPAMFFGFGLCYGAIIRLGEALLIRDGRWLMAGPLWVLGQIACLGVPVLLAVLYSYKSSGESGFRSYRDVPRA